MRLREFCQVWRVDDQLAAFLDDSAQFVTRFAANPQLVIMRIEQCDHAFVLPTRVANVNLSTDFGGPTKRFTNITRENRVRHELAIRFARDNAVEGNDARGDP